MRLMMILVVLLATTSSCGVIRRAVSEEEIVKHPDAPQLIQQAVGQARVAIYDRQNNKMIGYGWIDLSKLEGWTLHKFDWEKHIRKNEGD